MHPLDESQSPPNPQPFRLRESDALGFENGETVPVTWPRIVGDCESDDRGSAAALHWLRVGILIALEGGRADGIASRTAALACIAGLFDSPATAAAQIGLDRKAASRAHEMILAELKSQAGRSKIAYE
jgi:hypothetical protein